MALPTLVHEAGGALSRAAAAVGSQQTRPVLSSGSEQTPNGQHLQAGGNQGMDLHRMGGETVQLFRSSQHRLAPCPACLWAALGQPTHAPLPQPHGIFPHKQGGHRAGDLCSCAGAEAPCTTRVAFSQAVPRAGSNTGQAGFPGRLQGLTMLCLLFKFLAFI